MECCLLYPTQSSRLFFDPAAATKGSIDKIDTQEIQLMELNSLKEVANNIGDAEMCLSWLCPHHSAVGESALEGLNSLKLKYNRESDKKL